MSLTEESPPPPFVLGDVIDVSPVASLQRSPSHESTASASAYSDSSLDAYSCLNESSRPPAELALHHSFRSGGKGSPTPPQGRSPSSFFIDSLLACDSNLDSIATQPRFGTKKVPKWSSDLSNASPTNYTNNVLHDDSPSNSLDFEPDDIETDMISTYPPASIKASSTGLETRASVGGPPNEEQLIDYFTFSERYYERFSVMAATNAENAAAVESSDSPLITGSNLIQHHAQCPMNRHLHHSVADTCGSPSLSQQLHSCSCAVSSPHLHLLPHHQSQQPQLRLPAHANSVPQGLLSRPDSAVSPSAAAGVAASDAGLLSSTHCDSHSDLDRIPTMPNTSATMNDMVPMSQPQASSSSSSTRPSSVGPVKLHRRQKSGKRVPPPPVSAEALRAARLRLLEKSQHNTHSQANNSASSNPSSSSSSSSTHFSLALASTRSISPLSTPTSTTPATTTPSTSTSSTTPASSPRQTPRHSSAASSPRSYDWPCRSNSSLSNSSITSQTYPHYDYSLPNEVWGEVFKNLRTHNFIEMQLVSHQWASSCWETVKHLDLTGKCESQYKPSCWLKYLPLMTSLKSVIISSSLPTNEVVHILNQHTQIESLALHCDANTSADGLAPIGTWNVLTELALWLPRQVSPSALQPLIPQLTRLQYFKTETLRPTFCERAFTHLDKMESLRVLDLSWCKRLSPGIFAKIARLHSLEVLILDMCGDDVSMSGISNLRALPKLKELSLKWCDHLTDSMLPIIASFPALTTLDISFCRHLTSLGLAQHLPHISVSRMIPVHHQGDDDDD